MFCRKPWLPAAVTVAGLSDTAQPAPGDSGISQVVALPARTGTPARRCLGRSGVTFARPHLGVRLTPEPASPAAGTGGHEWQAREFGNCVSDVHS